MPPVVKVKTFLLLPYWTEEDGRRRGGAVAKAQADTGLPEEASLQSPELP